MNQIFPGMTVETSALEKGSSVLLFDGIFAAGGITLSQLSHLTGLEPYLIQNWVKRGFVPAPQKRLYSREQLARIVIINMLREALQIEKICELIRTSERLISDDALYHRYVDMLARDHARELESCSILHAATCAAEDFDEPFHGAKKQLANILQVMRCAHAASELRCAAQALLGTLT